LVKRADGVYVQFCIDVDRKENTELSGNTIGLDVGLKEYYTDSNGVIVENPKFLRQGEKVLAARNILNRGLSTVGHTGTLRLRSGHRFCI
jgi:hypothetical protein